MRNLGAVFTWLSSSKTTAINLANRKERRNPVNQSKLKVITCSQHEGWENVCGCVTIGGFGFTSDWTREWREFFEPITKRRNAKSKRMRITFYTQFKTTLLVELIWSQLIKVWKHVQWCSNKEDGLLQLTLSLETKANLDLKSMC